MLTVSHLGTYSRNLLTDARECGEESYTDFLQYKPSFRQLWGDSGFRLNLGMLVWRRKLGKKRAGQSPPEIRIKSKQWPQKFLLHRSHILIGIFCRGIYELSIIENSRIISWQPVEFNSWVLSRKKGTESPKTTVTQGLLWEYPKLFLLENSIRGWTPEVGERGAEGGIK